jgi:hypothetical protein
VFDIEFNETHRMLCAVIDGDIELSHSGSVPSTLDEMVMEDMARELLRHSHLFIEESCETFEVGILNYSRYPEEQFIMFQHSGKVDDLPDAIKAVLTLAEAESLDAGDWITIVDGEVDITGDMHPFLIHYEK